MVSPTPLRWKHHGLPLYQRYMRRRSVSALVRMMACSLSGSRLSSVRFLCNTQQSSCKNAFQMSSANGGLSVAASVSYCHELQHKGIPVWNPRNLVLWNCMLLNLDAIFGRWGRRGDGRWWGAGGCQFDSYRCRSRSHDSCRWRLSVQLIQLIIYRVITTCFSLYIYLICHCVINYVF